MNKNIKLQKRDTVYYKTKNGDDRTVVIDLSSGQSIKDYERDHCFIITKVERLQTIYEFKEVLDAKEKEYLSAVIRPFKNRVKNIHKVAFANTEYIRIEILGVCDGVSDSISLPLFKKGKMYKGMKRDKKYTLKELGLD